MEKVRDLSRIESGAWDSGLFEFASSNPFCLFLLALYGPASATPARRGANSASLRRWGPFLLREWAFLPTLKHKRAGLSRNSFTRLYVYTSPTYTAVTLCIRTYAWLERDQSRVCYTHQESSVSKWNNGICERSMRICVQSTYEWCGYSTQSFRYPTTLSYLNLFIVYFSRLHTVLYNYISVYKSQAYCDITYRN